MDIHKYLNTAQVNYINEHGNCDTEVSEKTTIRTVVALSRCKNSVSAGRLLSVICEGQFSPVIGTFCTELLVNIQMTDTWELGELIIMPLKRYFGY